VFFFSGVKKQQKSHRSGLEKSLEIFGKINHLTIKSKIERGITMIFAYTRISTKKDTQTHDRQKKTIKDYAKANNFTVDKWFEETITGKTITVEREEYGQLKKQLREGDILIVTDIDRLGRNANDTIAEIKALQAEGIKPIALDVPYMNEFQRMNDSSMANMIIDILVTLKAHIAQQELEKMVERINQGLAVAREKGTKLGRPILELPADFIRKYARFENGDFGKLSPLAFAKLHGISKSTFYRWVKAYNDLKLP
jgi:DNA invertase Pin-like site-specific DNA recombinase